MAALLCGMNKARKELSGQGISSFSEERLSEYEQDYLELIQKGREETKKGT